MIASGLALDGGAKEIVLTGTQLGAWGLDFSAPQHLADLLSALLARTSVPRLRLSSLEPWDLETGFFSLWQEERLCPHLHLPLQSGSVGVVKRMRRKATPVSFAALVQAARLAAPEIAITTDIITGFPGESEAEFHESLEFIQSMHFAGGHVFTYSARPGTPAARMNGQVRHEIRKERNALLQAVLAEAAWDYRQHFIGRKLSVLWEATATLSERGWQLEGLTGNYIRVKAEAAEPRWNRLDRVELIENEKDGLRGLIEENILEKAEN
jgi:threonylcarbamoyladenosine tRNA methylthiotransferase MtaB